MIFFLIFFNKFDLTQVNQNPSFEHDKSLHQAGLIFKVIKKKHYKKTCEQKGFSQLILGKK